MKRTYCGEDNDREPDDSLLDSHSQSDEYENELSKKLKIIGDTSTMVKNESLLQSQEITEPCDNVNAVAQQCMTDCSEVPESPTKDGKIIVFTK